MRGGNSHQCHYCGSGTEPPLQVSERLTKETEGLPKPLMSWFLSTVISWYEFCHGRLVVFRDLPKSGGGSRCRRQRPLEIFQAFSQDRPPAGDPGSHRPVAVRPGACQVSQVPPPAGSPSRGARPTDLVTRPCESAQSHTIQQHGGGNAVFGHSGRPPRLQSVSAPGPRRGPSWAFAADPRPGSRSTDKRMRGTGGQTGTQERQDKEDSSPPDTRPTVPTTGSIRLSSGSPLPGVKGK